MITPAKSFAYSVGYFLELWSEFPYKRSKFQELLQQQTDARWDQKEAMIMADLLLRFADGQRGLTPMDRAVTRQFLLSDGATDRTTSMLLTTGKRFGSRSLASVLAETERGALRLSIFQPMRSAHLRRLAEG